jgi:Terminase large subunit, T4likevirus-type, N-terminal
VERLKSGRGFGASFGDLSPWRRWITALRGLYGLPFSGPDGEIWQEHANMSPRPGGFKTALFLCGRQSGKSSIAAAIALHEVLDAPHPLTGETYSLLLAQDERAARRVLLAYATSLVENSPVYSLRLLTDPRKSELHFDNANNLLVLPCIPASIRGYRAHTIVCDEVCFLGDGVDEELITAARPALSSTDGRLVLISSPGAPSGVAYDMVQCNDPDVLIWRAPSYRMNPTISRTFLEGLKRHDPMAYEREIEGQFGATESTLLDPTQVERACRQDTTHLKPHEGVSYSAFVDLSGGRVDRAALAIVHVEGSRAIVDALHAWAPPFSPADFVQSCLPILARYGVHRVTGDYFGAELGADLWRAAGVEYQRSHLTRSQLLLSMVPVFGGGLCELPPDKLLVSEFKALQRRSTRAGREIADHPRSGSDDLCNAVSGAIVHALRWRPNPFETWGRMLEREASYVAVHAA